jgi:hypothetical protein
MIIESNFRIGKLNVAILNMPWWYFDHDSFARSNNVKLATLLTL